MNQLSLLRERWRALAGRERRLVLSGLALLLAALLWWLALAPALATLRTADQQRRVLDAQLQQMLRLQMQAKALHAQPPLAPDEVRRLLEASTRQQFGASAQLSVLGERVTLTLKGASADALAQWLSQVRVNARAVPAEARLQRSAAGSWDGTLVLNLSAR